MQNCQGESALGAGIGRGASHKFRSSINPHSLWKVRTSSLPSWRSEALSPILQNVSPSTWYAHTFRWPRREAPSKDVLKDAMIRMREKDLKLPNAIQ
jgi:hypothetical protein